jgi:hypothetical protein
MIKCIFTNIKNEHRYLEQWIEYHIRLGFNYFIFYQEKDSISHEDIINKYNKVCKIDFFDYLFNEDSFELKEITSFKHLLKNYNNIDWLINLNPDEYISLPDSMTIDDLFYNINDEVIKEIILDRKIYNANGFINEPMNGNYSLVDTYIDSINEDKLATFYDTNTSLINYKNTKAILNYKSFINEFNCDNLSNEFPYNYYDYDKENILYLDQIFIKYFITKSFEEFYNKINHNDIDMKIGDFFIYNPDMIDKIPEIENKFNINVFI